MKIKKYRIEYKIIDCTTNREKAIEETVLDAYNLKKAVDAFCITHSNSEVLYIMTKAEEVE